MLGRPCRPREGRAPPCPSPPAWAGAWLKAGDGEPPDPGQSPVEQGRKVLGRWIMLIEFELFWRRLLGYEDPEAHLERGILVGLALRQADLRTCLSAHAGD
ncbi:MAG TPA: hypothetical protein VKS82_22180 [Streptosporangiaceae bacterium]|nr:hypothetical protein [Streptosporangiaceae bacterium]